MDEPGTYSINGLAAELGVSYRRAAKMVRELEPVRTEGRVRYYLLADVIEADAPAGLDAGAELARLRKAQADLAEIQAAELAERLIPAEDVEDITRAYRAAYVAHLEALPQRMAVTLGEAVGASTATLEALLAEGVGEAINELQGAASGGS